VSIKLPPVPVSGQFLEVVFAIKVHETLHFLLENSKNFSGKPFQGHPSAYLTPLVVPALALNPLLFSVSPHSVYVNMFAFVRLFVLCKWKIFTIISLQLSLYFLYFFVNLILFITYAFHVSCYSTLFN